MKPVKKPSGGVTKPTPPAVDVAKLNSELLSCAESGDTERVKALIAAGANVNAKTYSGDTALIKAAEQGRASCVKALISAGADLNLKGHLHETALMKAAGERSWGGLSREGPYTECIKALIAAGADVNAQRDEYLHLTALMMAVEKGHEDHVKALIAAGTKLDMKDQHGRTALKMAVEQGKWDCVTALILAGAAKNLESWQTADMLMGAAKNGKADCVKALIAAGVNVNAKDYEGNTALMMAQPSVKGILRDAGAKITFKHIFLVIKEICIMAGYLLIWAATAFGIAALMHWLSRSFPIWAAGILGIVSAPFIVFCLLISAGNLDYEYLPILGGDRWYEKKYSAYRRIMLSVWAVLAVGIAALLYWLSSWFPTCAAAGLFGMLAAPILCPLALLLPEPVQLPSRKQINKTDYSGRTPLMRAAEGRDLRLIKALIRRGADLNAKNSSNSNTALIYAVYGAGVSAGCVKALIHAGAEVNAKNKDGFTALICSAIWGDAACAKALVDAGADINAEDKDGFTAFGHAKAHYHSDIAAILQAASTARDALKAATKDAASGRLAAESPSRSNWAGKHVQTRLASMDEKYARQVIVQYSAGEAKPPELGTLLLVNDAYFSLNMLPLCVDFVILEDGQGPFLVVRADGKTDQFRRAPLVVAYTFCRFSAGGLLAIFVGIDRPGYDTPWGGMVEGIIPLTSEFDLVGNRVARAFQLSEIHMCFAGASSQSGGYTSLTDGFHTEFTPPRCEFDRFFPVPPQVRELLMKEFTELQKYHSSLPAAKRDLRLCRDQFAAAFPPEMHSVAGYRFVAVPKPGTSKKGH